MSFDNSKVIATKGYLTGAADAIRRKLESQDTITLPEFEDAIDSIETGGGGTTATSVKIVSELPETLVEGAVYLIPNGHQYVPEFPTVSGGQYYACCCNNFSLVSYTVPTKTNLDNSTKFWLFVDDTYYPKCLRNAINTMSWGTSATTAEKPDHIFEYDTTGNFEWKELDLTDETVISDFANNNIKHDDRALMYSNVDVYRFTVGNIEYSNLCNSIKTDGKYKNIYYVDEFYVYFVENGTATSQGSHTLKWVAENYN